MSDLARLRVALERVKETADNADVEAIAAGLLDSLEEGGAEGFWSDYTDNGPYSESSWALVEHMLYAALGITTQEELDQITG